MSERLKQLLAEYNAVNEQAKRLPALREQLIAQINREGLQKTRFKMGGNVIQVESQRSYEGISQRLIHTALAKHYPQLDAKQVTAMIAASRRRSERQVLKVRPRTEGKR